ncbi:phage portal protein [Sphingomonas sp. HMP6]|uniref:phage portal protein n=1 Tax=Sphingomonas sp. HMP6 TaxID=1517551 RepID=UPI001596BD3F|nr:phage portal protein [Sphingomonas sp. HMP6]BCA57692.1 hypothetical protein HMP06_0461 [Sphingomonas sp. HMP6]
MAIAPGIVTRTLAMLRYARTGDTPAEWFGPGKARTNMAPPSVQGRAFDYPVFANINFQPRRVEPVGFPKLKQLAQNCEPLKLVMGRQTDLLKTLEWSIKARAKTATGSTDPDIIKITSFLERPDRTHDWSQWIGAVIDQVFVYDALSIYARPKVGGELYALELVDGATIQPLIDANGRPPMAPDEAYKQILKGVTAASYTRDELIYYPENYRVDHLYGQSRVEKIIITAETQIMRAKSHLGYFTHGNVGDGYFTAPELFQPDQIASLERNWNAQMSGDMGQRLADRREVPWLPAGTEFHATKIDIFQELFDEWLIRLICFGFGVSPSPFIKTTGLGNSNADSDKEAAAEGGISQLMQFIQRLMNHIVADKFKRPDLEFSWDENRAIDPQIAATIQDIKLRNGVISLDEARDQDGKEALPDGLGAKPLIYTAQGAVTVDSILNPPPPPPMPATLPIDPAADTAAPKTEKPGDLTTAKPDLLAKAAADTEAKLARTVATFLKARGSEIAAELADALGMEKAADEGPDSRIDKAFDDIDWDWGALGTVTEPIIARLAVAAAIEAAGEVGLFDKATLNRVTARATAWAHERSAELVGMKWIDGELVANPKAEWSISENTRKMLRSSISKAMEDGLSNAELAKAIRADTAFSADRASMIARTETAIADVQGSLAGYRASGLVEGKQWLSSDDCCDDCAALDGTIVGLDEDFPGGSDAPLHQNCRCDILPVLPEDMPDVEVAPETT